MKKNISKTQSIKSRLLIWLTIPLTISMIILFVYIYFLVNTKVNNFFDKTLYASAKSMENSIGVKHGSLSVDLVYFALDLLSSNTEGLIFYSIVDENNKLLVGYKDLLKKDLLKNKDKLFYNTVYLEESLRAVSFKTSIISAGKTHIAIITIAESTEGRLSTSNDILTQFIYYYEYCNTFYNNNISYCCF